MISQQAKSKFKMINFWKCFDFSFDIQIHISIAFFFFLHFVLLFLTLFKTHRDRNNCNILTFIANIHHGTKLWHNKSFFQVNTLRNFDRNHRCLITINPSKLKSTSGVNLFWEILRHQQSVLHISWTNGKPSNQRKLVKSTLLKPSIKFFQFYISSEKAHQ